MEVGDKRQASIGQSEWWPVYVLRDERDAGWTKGDANTEVDPALLRRWRAARKRFEKVQSELREVWIQANGGHL